MRDISIPARDWGTLDSVAPGVHGLQTVMVNLYTVTAPDGSWVLIDTGLPFFSNRILSWVGRQFGPGARPSCIVLTHGHFDHIGAVKELSEAWDVPVYAHPLEFPYLTGRSKYPPPDPTVGGGAFTILSVAYPRGPIDIGPRLQVLPADGTVPGLPGWRWIHTPGHTAGHVSLFRDQDRVLIAGDALVTTKQESAVAVATQRPEWHGPPAYYTSDWGAAAQSVARLAGLEPVVVATGHGIPIGGPDVADQLDDLASNFDDWARPSDGRYVREAAVTDERGIVRLPPPILGNAPRALALVAACALLLIAGQRLLRRV